MKVVAVDNCWREYDAVGHIVERMLDGARAGGAETEHFILCSSITDVPENMAGRVKVIDSRERMKEVISSISGAGHLIIGLTGEPRKPGALFGDFLDVCYENAKWIAITGGATPDEVIETEEEAEEAGQIEAKVKFPSQPRPITDEHRGLVIFQPIRGDYDDKDPWSDRTFFILEEAMRILGFMPSGRILSTGLFYPPLDENPVLNEQAYGLGRRLAYQSVTEEESAA